jgi:alanine racemase
MKSMLTWVEISAENLKSNIRKFRELVGNETLLCPCIKGNAYGHGLVECAQIFLDGGADWLCVNALYEARELRENGITAPICVLGYIELKALEEAVDLDLRLVVYNSETVEKLGEIGKDVKIHLKVETGNNRQGVLTEDLIGFAKFAQDFENIEIEGLSTHFANIEDTTDHSYAQSQIEKFKAAGEKLEEAGIKIKLMHCANSAATILFKKTHFDLTRVGISSYGMWPSNETYVSYLKEIGGEFNLAPAFTWKTKIAQVKEIPAGEFVGYGCTFKTTHPTRLGIIPVGYYDGYDRGVSGGFVLVGGARAAIRGRVCMNIIMIDLTDIPEAKLEDEVVLIGRDGDEEISAELFASWAGTINYEVTTRVNDRIKRIIV